MKSCVRRSIILAAALFTAAGARAADDQVAYLGVMAGPVDPVTAHHLNLPPGVGVTAVQVADDGVLKGKIEPFDIFRG